MLRGLASLTVVLVAGACTDTNEPPPGVDRFDVLEVRWNRQADWFRVPATLVLNQGTDTFRILAGIVDLGPDSSLTETLFSRISRLTGGSPPRETRSDTVRFAGSYSSLGVLNLGLPGDPQAHFVFVANGQRLGKYFARTGRDLFVYEGEAHTYHYRQ